YLRAPLRRRGGRPTRRSAVDARCAAGPVGTCAERWRGLLCEPAAAPVADLWRPAQQVEGLEGHAAGLALATKPLEHREPILVAGHGLSIDQARAYLEPAHSF